ncbi:hypothetical protein [Streptomyces sp. NPDC046862]|uniref:hypothetical protein n=1 Tax=Streptomyces sp. NPDC046862 TaxID=3154603 RepID=UPI003451213B
MPSVTRPTASLAPLVCVIAGMPGVGKTRLAVRTAHEITQRQLHDEVQLFADLHGVSSGGEPRDSALVLDGFLRMLGVVAEEIPDSVEDRASMYRDRWHGRPSLVVPDDAAGAGHVLPPLPASPASLVLITSRRSTFDLDGAKVLPLAPFTTQESVTLLKRVTGERVAAERANAELIADLCGGLPLAVGPAAMRLRNRPLWRPTDLVDRLTPTAARLGQLALGGRAVRAEFDASYNRLPPSQQRMLRLLAEAPTPGFEPDAVAVAVASGVAPHQAEELLERLLDECLVQPTSSHRYRLHELMRVYAENAGAT